MLNIWWSKGPKPGNFGDILTPYVLDYYGIKYKYTDRSKADSISIGSIAKFARDGMIVLGSGTARMSDILAKGADWRFVRGPYTRKKILECGGSCPEIYSDPALLLPFFLEESEKEYDLGIVPHYVDREYVKTKYGKELKNGIIIDLINADPLSVAREITKCRKIISSSLHGIIAAHAYNIPAAWVEFSDKVQGDGTKFADHFASVGLTDITKSSPFRKPTYHLPRYINTDLIEEQFRSLV